MDEKVTKKVDFYRAWESSLENVLQQTEYKYLLTRMTTYIKAMHQNGRTNGH